MSTKENIGFLPEDDEGIQSLQTSVIKNVFIAMDLTLSLLHLRFVYMHLEIIILFFHYVVDRLSEMKTRCLLPEDVPDSNLDLSRLTSYHVDRQKRHVFRGM